MMDPATVKAMAKTMRLGNARAPSWFREFLTADAMSLKENPQHATMLRSLVQIVSKNKGSFDTERKVQILNFFKGCGRAVNQLNLIGRTADSITTCGFEVAEHLVPALPVADVEEEDDDEWSTESLTRQASESKFLSPTLLTLLSPTTPTLPPKSVSEEEVDELEDDCQSLLADEPSQDSEMMEEPTPAPSLGCKRSLEELTPAGPSGANRRPYKASSRKYSHYTGHGCEIEVSASKSIYLVITLFFTSFLLLFTSPGSSSQGEGSIEGRIPESSG